MGDKRRFEKFAKLISIQFPNKNIRIADVAGGQGYLQIALRGLGYKNVVTFDKRYKHIKRINYKYGYFTCGNDFDLLVGMHPDEATDIIVNEACRNGLPFVIVPCCIKSFSIKTHGKNFTFTSWIKYLKSLYNGQIEELQLKISGKNLTLIGRVK